MTQAELVEMLQNRPLLLDGATGTHLQAAGLPTGMSPEAWVLDNPDVLRNLQHAYYQAGSQIVLTFTFGGNRPKLTSQFAPEPDVSAINHKLAEISTGLRDDLKKKNPSCSLLVAGDIGPTGHFLYPAGDLTLSTMVGIYREQVRGLLAAGVDLFVVETMMDLSETRAAVLAIQSECNLPVIATLTFAGNGRTLSGNDPLACLLTLAGLGVSACGVNCSFGPEKSGELIGPLLEISPIPLVLKPNAGLPQLVDGKTVFPMDPDAFAVRMLTLARSGIQILGGCCGTGPDHIRVLSGRLNEMQSENPIFSRSRKLPPLICSPRHACRTDQAADWPVVECGGIDNLIDDVLDTIADESAAVVLEIDGNLPQSEWDNLGDAIVQIQAISANPLIFRTKNPVLLETLLRLYCGRAGYAGAKPARNYGALFIEGI